MRRSIAVLLFLPLAWPASAQQRPAVNLLVPPAAIEVRPLPPVAAPAPDAEEEQDKDDRSADLRRQQVAYAGPEIPGTIIVDTAHTHLFLVMDGGKAMRYGIGVGRDGFTWNGRERVSRMAEWPDWYPPKEMIERQPYLPRIMAGGVGNPLGARALYLGSTLYRIHGTNQPNTIGKYVSSGCIRLTNEDIEDLYGRVKVGAQVVVLQADGSAPPAQAVPPAKSVPPATGRPSAPVLSNRQIALSSAPSGLPAVTPSVIPLPRPKPAAVTRATKAANGTEAGRKATGNVAAKAKDSAKVGEAPAKKPASKPAKVDTRTADAGQKSGPGKVAKLELERKKIISAKIEAKSEIKTAPKSAPKTPSKPKGEAKAEAGGGKK